MKNVKNMLKKIKKKTIKTKYYINKLKTCKINNNSFKKKDIIEMNK